MHSILFVDDEPIVKVALRTMVDWETLGCTVCATASDGAEALEQVEKYGPDIIITDLKMPGMDGLGLIRELRARNYPGKIIVASNFGEYELVREALTLGAMDYILKISIKPAELATLVKKAAAGLEAERQTRERQDTERRKIDLGMKRIRSTLLKEYFLDPGLGEDFLTENETPFRPLLKSRLCLLLLPSPRGAADGGRTIPPRTVENLLREILNTVEETEVLSIDSEHLLIIFSQEELEKKRTAPADLIRRTEDALRVYLGVSPSAVYSPAVQGYVPAKEQFCLCRDAAESLFYGYRDVIFAGDVMLQESVEGISPNEFSARLAERLEIADQDGCMELIERLLENCRLRTCRPQVLKTYLLKALGFLSARAFSLHVSDAEAFDSALEQLPACTDCDSLKEVCGTALGLLKNRDLPDGGAGMKREVLLAVRYINRNYSKKITLAEIGKQVNLNENYLSRVFREQTGKSVVNYLNEVRMKHAARLLLENGGYMKEVAVAVGIEDSFYFTRLFKKYYGVSPTEYKALQAGPNTQKS